MNQPWMRMFCHEIRRIFGRSFAFLAVAVMAASPVAIASGTNSTASPEGVLIERDVVYLEAGRKEKLDLYQPAADPGNALRPAMVLIHGGGWTGGDKAQARELEIGTTLARAGYVCVSVEYQKSGDNRWPTNLKDCKNAVRFLRAHVQQYHVDPVNIGVLGGSAGGHLALLVAYTPGMPELTPVSPYPGISDSVKVCVDLYGVTDLLTRRATAGDGSPTGELRDAGLFPDPRGTNPEKWRLASPVSHVSSQSPPTLILHGMADTTVDRDQSVQLASTLAAAGVEYQLKLIPGVGHTFDLEQWQHKPLPTDLRPLVIEFLDRHLKPRRTALASERP
jgi:acetyl esterase/lipase